MTPKKSARRLPSRVGDVPLTSLAAKLGVDPHSAYLMAQAPERLSPSMKKLPRAACICVAVGEAFRMEATSKR